MGLIYYFKRKFTKDKGVRFEEDLAKLLHKKFNFNRGYNFKDLILIRGDKTSQIDDILVTKRAIYVIEAKARFGLITLKDNDTLVQTLNKNLSHEFRNPMLQNEVHIGFLRSILKDNEVKMTSLIVFPDDTTIKLNNQSFVNLKDLVSTIKNLEKINRKQKIKIAKKKRALIIENIKKANKNTYKNRKEHLKYIESKKN